MFSLSNVFINKSLGKNMNGTLNIICVFFHLIFNTSDNQAQNNLTDGARRILGPRVLISLRLP
jgi:hypothetical protein